MLRVIASMHSCVNVYTSILYMALKYTALPRHAAVFIKEFVNALNFCLKCTKSFSPSQEIAGDGKKTKQKNTKNKNHGRTKNTNTIPRCGVLHSYKWREALAQLSFLNVKYRGKIPTILS